MPRIIENLLSLLDIDALGLDDSLGPLLDDALAEDVVETLIVDAFDSTSLDFFYTDSDTSASVVFAGNTVIEASDDVEIDVYSQSRASPSGDLLILGAAYGDAKSEAEARIGGQTRITAGGDVRLFAEADNQVSPSVDISFSNVSMFGFTWSKSDASATAVIGVDATVEAGDLEVNAQTLHDIENTTSVVQVGNGALGISFAINQFESHADAHIDGTVIATGDVDVIAGSKVDGVVLADVTNNGDSTSPLFGFTNFVRTVEIVDPLDVILPVLILGLPLSDDGTEAAKDIILILEAASILESLLYSIFVPAPQQSSFNLGASLAITTGLDFGKMTDGVGALNDVQAYIASTADVEAGDDVHVTATLENGVTLGATTGANSNGATIGGAFAWGTFTDRTAAFIDDGATVDVMDALGVVADTEVPDAIDGTLTDVGDAVDTLTLPAGIFSVLSSLFLNTFAFNSSSGSSIKGTDTTRRSRLVGIVTAARYRGQQRSLHRCRFDQPGRDATE